MRINDAPKDIESYSRHYDEKGLWNKLTRHAKRAGLKLVYCALLCYYVLVSHDVPARYKLTIAGALGYLILPLDAIPDFIPVAGYVDDLSAILAVLKTVSSCVTPDIRNKAVVKLHDFFGEIDNDEIDRLSVV